MTGLTLMVHLDPDGANDARVNVAAMLAERLAASVVGVTACELGQPFYFVEGPAAAQMIAQGRSELKQRMAAMEGAFRFKLQDRAKNVEWRSALDMPAGYVVQQVRAADLVITGSNPGGAILDPLTHVDPGDLLMHGGRPVLIVPPEAGALDLNHAIVAWKDTREARRAVLDALPVLQQAAQVTVVEVIEDHGDEGSARARVGDVAAWLARHGIKVAASTATGTATEQLDALAAGVGASLVVAGGYGHSRLHEWALGGVTRDLITRSRRCSLLSH